MSHHCRQCDGHVMPDDDGGFCSLTCEAEAAIAENNVDRIVQLLRIEAAARRRHAACGQVFAEVTTENDLWKELE